MGLDLDHFISLRPKLLHVTTPGNATLIERQGLLRPAGDTLEAAGLGAMIRERRPEAMRLRVPGAAGRVRETREVYVRDQAPLKAGNMRLEGGWSLARFIEELNSHVYFWPAADDGAGAYARRLFDRYAGQGQVVMAFDSSQLIGANRDSLRLCACNSGAPRCNPRSGKAPRGPGTFLPIERFELSAGRVQEVAFRGTVTISNALTSVSPVESWLDSRSIAASTQSSHRVAQ